MPFLLIKRCYPWVNIDEFSWPSASSSGGAAVPSQPPKFLIRWPSLSPKGRVLKGKKFVYRPPWKHRLPVAAALHTQKDFAIGRVICPSKDRPLRDKGQQSGRWARSWPVAESAFLDFCFLDFCVESAGTGIFFAEDCPARNCHWPALGVLLPYLRIEILVWLNYSHGCSKSIIRTNHDPNNCNYSKQLKIQLDSTFRTCFPNDTQTYWPMQRHTKHNPDISDMLHKGMQKSSSANGHLSEKMTLANTHSPLQGSSATTLPNLGSSKSIK